LPNVKKEEDGEEDDDCDRVMETPSPTFVRLSTIKAQEDEFTQLLFNDRIFDNGITASDFQANLQKLSSKSMPEIKKMLSDFESARAEHSEKRTNSAGTSSLGVPR